jgi:polyisoprenoid-binding protein YceI
MEIEGILTVKSVTKLVSMTVTSFQYMPNLLLKKDSIGANAVAKFNRTEFNMGKYAPYVSDDVTLIIAMEAVKE